MTLAPWMIYGATGYTGQLLVDEAVARGHRPIVAGRSEEKVRPIAEARGLEWRAVPLDDPGGLRAALEGVKLVLHAAGPFVYTSAPMVRACLDVGAHYTDITGELPVFEAIFAQDPEAERRGVCLMPGIGFDVIPTDCLAVHTASRVRHPRKLEIAIAALGQPSGGTARSMLELMKDGLKIRRIGGIRSTPPFKGTRQVRFAERESFVVPAPLADLETAHHSTGIEDITTYFAVNRRVAKTGRALWPLAAAGMPIVQAALNIGPLRTALGEAIQRRVHGADETARAKSSAHLWCRVEGTGEAAESTLETLDGYDFTRIAAIRTVETILAKSPKGAKTPAQVLGADFVLEMPSTTRADRPG